MAQWVSDGVHLWGWARTVPGTGPFDTGGHVAIFGRPAAMALAMAEPAAAAAADAKLPGAAPDGAAQAGGGGQPCSREMRPQTAETLAIAIGLPPSLSPSLPPYAAASEIPA